MAANRVLIYPSRVTAGRGCCMRHFCMGGPKKENSRRAVGFDLKIEEVGRVFGMMR